MAVSIGKLLLINLFCLFVAGSVEVAGNGPDEALSSDCAACHGPKGAGIPPLCAPKISGLEAWYVERQMNNYKAGIRGDHPEDLYGSQMVLFARALHGEGDITQLAAYIASFPNTPALATIKGDLGRGGEIYEICATCHGQRGEGNQDFGAPRLAGMDDWYLVDQLRNFRAGVRGYSDSDSFGKGHAARTGRLTDDASIMDVVAYINFLFANDLSGQRGHPVR